jgi:hypothetical protein
MTVCIVGTGTTRAEGEGIRKVGWDEALHLTAD